MAGITTTGTWNAYDMTVLKIMVWSARMARVRSRIVYTDGMTSPVKPKESEDKLATKGA